MIKNFLYQLSKPYYFTLFSAVVLMVGLVFSPFLLSLGIWGLALASFAHQLLNITLRIPQQLPSRRKILSLTLEETFRNLWQQPVYLCLTGLLAVTALSGLWSSDIPEWLERVRVRIPFFVLPWAFANLPTIQTKHYKNLLYFLVCMMVIACVGVGINYYLNAAVINTLMEKGQPIPVPRNHIRFSLILAFAIFVSGWLYSEKHYIKYPSERMLLAIYTFFLLVFLHFLAVRSGIIAFYTSVAVLFYFTLFQWRRWKHALGIVLLGTMIGVAAVNYLPSVQKKISYMRWSYDRIKEGKGDIYSDGQRIVSLQMGLSIFKEKPIFGIGTGDVPSEIYKKTFERYPNFQEEPKMPHNQFIYILAATGLLGLIVSLFAIYYPLFLKPYRYNVLLWIFHAILFASFLGEYTLESTIGANFFAFFHLFLLKMTVERSKSLDK